MFFRVNRIREIGKRDKLETKKRQTMKKTQEIKLFPCF